MKSFTAALRILACAVLAVALWSMTGNVVRTTPALAHKGAHGVVKERMRLMKKMEKRLRLITKMEKGELPFDADAVHRRGEQLLKYARKIPRLFPRGSGAPPSEASARIWQDFAAFQAEGKKLEQAAMLLMQASAATLPDIARQLRAACKSCHEKYRVERD